MRLKLTPEEQEESRKKRKEYQKNYYKDYYQKNKDKIKANQKKFYYESGERERRIAERKIRRKSE